MFCSLVPKEERSSGAITTTVNHTWPFIILFLAWRTIRNCEFDALCIRSSDVGVAHGASKHQVLGRYCLSPSFSHTAVSLSKSNARRAVRGSTVQTLVVDKVSEVESLSLLSGVVSSLAA